MSYFDRRKKQFDFRNPKIIETTSKDKTVTFKTAYIWFIFIIVLLGLAAWWVFYSQFFKIKNIEISGTVNDSIKKEIDSFKGKNIFLFVVGQKDKELASRQTSIEKINIVKGIPDTLKIEVLVRKPVIRWKSKDVVYFIDEKGIAFSLEAPTESDNKLPQVTDSRNLDVKVGGRIVTKEFVDFVNNLAVKLPEKIKKETEEYKVDETTLHLEVKFKDSYKVFFDTTTDLDNQIYLLSKIIEKHDAEITDYIDLRVENRGYYK